MGEIREIGIIREKGLVRGLMRGHTTFFLKKWEYNRFHTIRTDMI